MLRRTLLAACLPLPGAGAAQAQSGFVGTVVNAVGKQPIANVSVTASSPNLEKPRTVSTDASGNHALDSLPPGIYTLRLENGGYKPYERGSLQLRLNRTLRVNLEMLPPNLSGAAG